MLRCSPLSAQVRRSPTTTSGPLRVSPRPFWVEKPADSPLAVQHPEGRPSPAGVGDRPYCQSGRATHAPGAERTVAREQDPDRPLRVPGRRGSACVFVTGSGGICLPTWMTSNPALDGVAWAAWGGDGPMAPTGPLGVFGLVADNVSGVEADISGTTRSIPIVNNSFYATTTRSRTRTRSS